MAVKTISRRVSRTLPAPQSRWKNLLVQYLPGWIALAAALIILMPRAMTITLSVTGRVLGAVPAWISNLLEGPSSIAPLFTPEVHHWSGDIGRWAREYSLDPNLLATVMQIESCGHPTVRSYAGAQGLFQVMPFHFGADENQLDPDTNAHRAADYLKICVSSANGDTGLAMACYNGGQSIITQPYAYWQDQTQRYYHWGTGIYNDALNHQSHSDTLDQWLAAGGSTLCQQAGSALGM
jgi:soluble lytic murein transglycosylase-like protein